MSPALLSRGALARVLQSLLTSELATVRRRAGSHRGLTPGSGRWSDDFQIVGTSAEGLGCDSLEIMWLAGAVNEMFHLHEIGSETALLSAATFGDWIDLILAAWHAGVSDVTFSTSGTTGMPKRCTHAFSDLQTEIRFLAAVFSTRRRIVAMAPPHHIYGCLFTALLPDHLAIAVVDGADASVTALRPGDLIVSFPDRWSYLNRFVPAWPADVQGVVSTAPCPPSLIASLMAQGLSSMTEIYGSSETAGIGLRTWPDQTYRLMPHWTFALPVDPAAPVLIHACGSRVQLMDHIAMRADDGFVLMGRHDGAVQVAGINVYPERIAALLRERPGVADARVRLMRPEEGNRLKAFVVPSAGLADATLRVDLEAWSAANLTTSERPKTFTIGAALPCDPMGKPADW